DKPLEVTVGGVPLAPEPRLPAFSGSSRRQGSTDSRQVARDSQNVDEAAHPPVEAGTGFYERRFVGPEVNSKLGEITVKKADAGAAWASVHWQYLEDMSKVTAYEGTPLKLKKSLFTKVNKKKGALLEAVKGQLNVGDELVVRIELRVDRD